MSDTNKKTTDESGMETRKLVGNELTDLAKSGAQIQTVVTGTEGTTDKLKTEGAPTVDTRHFQDTGNIETAPVGGPALEKKGKEDEPNQRSTDAEVFDKRDGTVTLGSKPASNLTRDNKPQPKIVE